MTIVVAPGTDEELEIAKAIKGSSFDPARDAKVNVNVIKVAKSLNNTVEMSDKEFRAVLRNIFPDMPGFHIDAVVKLAKESERPERSIDRLSRLVGGIL